MRAARRIIPIPGRIGAGRPQTAETTPKIYTATLSAKAKLITYAVGFGVGLGVPLVLATAFYSSFGDPLVWLLPAVFATVLALARAFRPTGYRLSPASLEVLRPVGGKSFPVRDMASVRFPAQRPPGFILGICRVEGLYGAWGVYWSRAWGLFRVYVTDDANRVEIGFRDGRRLILSPDDPQGFVADLEKVIAGGP